MMKTMSVTNVHFLLAFSVAYAITGSIRVGGAMALAEPAINTVPYYLHEQVWNHVPLTHFK